MAIPPQEAADRLHKYLLEKQGEQKPVDKVEPKFKVGDEMSVTIKEIDAENRRISLVPSTSTEQDYEASEYFSTHSDDDGDTYNPFAALLKK